MNKLVFDLTYSLGDIIAAIAAILTLIGIIVSLCIAVKTLKQNEKMIDASTRPYLVIYLGFLYVQDLECYFVLRNFGASAARVNSVTTNTDLSSISKESDVNLLSSFTAMVVAPNQRYLQRVDGVKLSSLKEPIVFDLNYSTPQKSYAESFIINPEVLCEIEASRASTTNKELKIISYTLQDIAEKMI